MQSGWIVGWRRGTRGIVWTSPAVAGNEVIVAEGAGRIRALDPASGETLWETFLRGFLNARRTCRELITQRSPERKKV